MKKIVSLLLIVLITVGVLGGCKPSKETNTKADVKKETKKEETKEESNKGDKATKTKTNPVDIVVWTNDLDYIKDESYGKKWIEERYNINAKYEKFLEVEQIRLKVASGDIPQYWQNCPLEDYQKFVDEEVIKEIPMKYIKKYAPKYYEWVTKHVDDPWKYLKIDGKIFSLPAPWTIGKKYTVLGIRKDWMDNVGVKKVPTTLEELEEVYIKFRENDPDKNNKKDTYAFSGVGADKDLFKFFSFVFAAFDVYPNTYIKKGDKYVRGEVEQGAKKALEVLHRWYENGIIDPEFMVKKYDNVKKTVVAGKAGSTLTGWWNFIPVDCFCGGYFYENMKDSGAEWMILPAPKGEKGHSGTLQSNPIFDAGFVIGSNTTDEQMIKILEIINDSSFNREAQENLKKGVKGVTYNHDEKNGYTWIKPYDEQAKRKEFGIDLNGISVGGCFNDYDLLEEFMTQPSLKELRRKSENMATGKYDELGSVLKPVWSDNKDHLTQLTLDNYIKFIIGDRPIDEFEDYVQEWLNAGGKEVLEEAQEILKKYN